MAKLYVNGLLWKEMNIANIGIIHYEILTDDSSLLPTSFESFIEAKRVSFHSQTIVKNGKQEIIFKIDDPKVYVDIISQDLRYRSNKIKVDKEQVIKDEPVESRFELLDI